MNDPIGDWYAARQKEAGAAWDAVSLWRKSEPTPKYSDEWCLWQTTMQKLEEKALWAGYTGD